MQRNTREGSKDYRQCASSELEFTTWFQILRDDFFPVTFEIVAIPGLCKSRSSSRSGSPAAYHQEGLTVMGYIYISRFKCSTLVKDF